MIMYTWASRDINKPSSVLYANIIMYNNMDM